MSDNLRSNSGSNDSLYLSKLLGCVSTIISSVGFYSRFNDELSDFEFPLYFASGLGFLISFLTYRYSRFNNENSSLRDNNAR